MTEQPSDIFEIGVEEVRLAHYSELEDAERAAKEYPAHLFFDGEGRHLRIGKQDGDADFEAELRSVLRFGIATAQQHQKRLRDAGYSQPDEFEIETQEALESGTLEELVTLLRHLLDPDDGDRDRKWCCFWHPRCCH